MGQGTGRIAVALAGAGANADLLMPHVLTQVKVVQDGEDYAAVVVDEAGSVRTNNAMKNMTLKRRRP